MQYFSDAIKAVKSGKGEPRLLRYLRDRTLYNMEESDWDAIMEVHQCQRLPADCCFVVRLAHK